MLIQSVACIILLPSLVALAKIIVVGIIAMILAWFTLQLAISAKDGTNRKLGTPGLVFDEKIPDDPDAVKRSCTFILLLTKSSIIGTTVLPNEEITVTHDKGNHLKIVQPRVLTNARGEARVVVDVEEDQTGGGVTFTAKATVKTITGDTDVTATAGPFEYTIDR